LRERMMFLKGIRTYIERRTMLGKGMAVETERI
jgi:hypothetical protein